MTDHYEPKTDDRYLLEAIQSRVEESKAKPDVIIRAIKNKLKQHLGAYVAIKRPVLCVICHREIPQKIKGARRKLCNKRCRKKWTKMQRSHPAYKLWRKEFDARPEQKARRLKYMNEVYLPKKQQERDDND